MPKPEAGAGPAFGPEAPPQCPLCPRLAAFRDANRAAHPDWFNGAVPSFGPAEGEAAVRLLIIGLAPGLEGANRTGRPFTGDWAGDLLYATLLSAGLAHGTYAERADDGLRLDGTMISNAVRCVPPQNKPNAAEINTCRPFLRARLSALPGLRAILCLGRISHDQTLRALDLRPSAIAFAHGAAARVPGPHGPLTLVSSYHCSRYNTNTGRLTAAMFEAAMATAKAAAFG